MASSSAVYGNPREESEAINESYVGRVNFIGPRACYNEGKRFAETLVTTYYEHYKLNTRIARIFTTYGPRMKLLSGRQLPDFIYNALNGRDLEVKGDDKTGSSLCYVKDMVEGLVALMKSDYHESINLGSDRFYTFKEVAEKIIKMTSSEAKVNYGDPIKYSHRQSVPDIALAKDKLGVFELVAMVQGLSESIASARSNLVRTKGFGTGDNDD